MFFFLYTRVLSIIIIFTGVKNIVFLFKSSDRRAFMNPKNEHPAGWYLFWGLIIAGAIVGASALIGFLWLGHIIDVKAFNTILYS